MIPYSSTLHYNLSYPGAHIFYMKYTEINTLQDLSNYLRCEISFLNNILDNGLEVIDAKEHDWDETDHTKINVVKFYIPKKGKNGGARIVYHAWTHQHSNTLKILSSYLNQIYTPNSCVHGYVKRKNIKTNAAQHLAKNIILSVDIKDFFETITVEMIVSNLVKIGFQQFIAESIAKIITINGALAPGFATSPIMANIVSEKLDSELIKFCNDNIVYTRYADDLYFSSNDAIPDLEKITTIIENHDFILNDSKTKFMKRGSQQYVTGLTTFDNLTPRISKKKKRNIRLEIHYIKKFGYKKHCKKKLIKSGLDKHSPDFKELVEIEAMTTRDKLFGWLHYINSIEPDFAAKYYREIKGAKL